MRAGGGHTRIFEFFSKNLTVLKIVAQCRKYPIPYLHTLNRTIPYLNTLNQTIHYVEKNPNLAQNQFGGQSESSITVPKHTLSIAETYPILIH